MLICLFSNFKKRKDGATTIEFALCALPFFLLFTGIIEFGLFMMTQVALESAVTQAGRSSSISQFVDTATQTPRASAVEALIRQKTGGLINNGQIIFAEQTLSAGGAVPPDVCFNKSTNKPILPAPSACGDKNSPNTYFIKGSGSPNVAYVQPSSENNGGGKGDMVEIRATYPWHVLFPILGQYFGDNGTVLITSSTIILNE